MGELSREEVLAQELDRLREERLRVRTEVEDAKRERERLLAQMRDANEQLVLATLRADELADEAHAARAVIAASLEIEAEGRRRAEALAAQLQRREEELRASESQFQTLANTAPMLAWYASPGGDIAWFNQRWYDYTGTVFHEQAGWKWESVVDPDDLPRIVETWRARTGKRSRTVARGGVRGSPRQAHRCCEAPGQHPCVPREGTDGVTIPHDILLRGRTLPCASP